MTIAVERRSAAPAEPPNRRSRGRGIALGGVLAVVVGFAFGYRAEVVVSAPTEAIEATARVPVAEPSLPPETVTRQATAPTTGGRGVAHATGRVRFDYTLAPSSGECASQGDCPPAELVVPQGTRVATCVAQAERPCRPEVVFATVAPVRVRMRTFVEAEVRAIEPGSRGNVFARIEAVLDPPQQPHVVLAVFHGTETRGGADSAGGVVARADIEGVAAGERERVRAQAADRLTAAAKRRGLAVAAMQVDVRVAAEPAEGSPGETVTVTMTATATGSGYRRAELEEAARRALAAARPAQRFVVPGSVAVPGVEVQGREVVGRAAARVSAVDPGAVARRTARRAASAADRELERVLGHPARIEGRPFELPFTPLSPSRVEVRIQEL